MAFCFLFRTGCLIGLPTVMLGADLSPAVEKPSASFVALQIDQAIAAKASETVAAGSNGDRFIYRLDTSYWIQSSEVIRGRFTKIWRQQDHALLTDLLHMQEDIPGQGEVGRLFAERLIAFAKKVYTKRDATAALIKKKGAEARAALFPSPALSRNIGGMTLEEVVENIVVTPE